MSDVKYSGDKVLDIMSANATNRNNAIAFMLKIILEELPANARVLEIGAGKGEFILRFLKWPVELNAIEIDQSYAGALSKSVRVFNSIEECEGEFDFIYLIDVLEHIDDDSKMLRQIFNKLKKGGKLFIYVPARNELYSAFDKSIGHFRRFTKNELRMKVSIAGFKVNAIKYHDMLGYVASCANKIFSRSGELNARAVKIYDSNFFPLGNFIEGFLPAPIGKSLYISATK